MKTKIKTLIAPAVAAIAAAFPTLAVFAVARRLLGIQLSARQLKAIAQSIDCIPGSDLLVFGLGNDSPLWAALNRGGRTAFVENHPEWHRTVTARFPSLEAYLVTYHSRIEQWRDDLGRSHADLVELPIEIALSRWDIILVDGPGGWQDGLPGRVGSMLAAKALGRSHATVYVHDCNRQVEDQASRLIFGPEREEIRDHQRGHLRRFRLTK